MSACASLRKPPIKSDFMDFKDTVYPLFESDTLFLECVCVLFLVVQRFFESRDVYTVHIKGILGMPYVF